MSDDTRTNEQIIAEALIRWQFDSNKDKAKEVEAALATAGRIHDNIPDVQPENDSDRLERLERWVAVNPDATLAQCGSSDIQWLQQEWKSAKLGPPLSPHAPVASLLRAVASMRLRDNTPPRTLHYASNVRNSGPSNTAPEGWSERRWHQDAMGDTHTSHTLPGWLYIVQCEWCFHALAANSKAEAMGMFRTHEDDMLKQERDES